MLSKPLSLVINDKSLTMAVAAIIASGVFVFLLLLINIVCLTIDDVSGKTLVSASSLDKDVKAQKVTKLEKSKMVGAAIARKAADLGIANVVFDRSGYLYHGRVKALADGAREGGLQF